jgi:hypothetical protein
MSSPRLRRLALVILVGSACGAAAAPTPAQAFNPLKPVCALGGLVSGLVGKACTVVEHGGRLISAGKKLASGHLGSAVKTALGSGASAVGSKATFALGLAAVVTWVVGGAKYVLHATADVIGRTTSPQLRSTWFSGTYWRVAGIAALLTLPFLFAAAIQALIQSDITLLIRAALGYLPLAMLCVSIAAPLTMLLLAASDQMSAIVSSAAGHASTHFLNRAAGVIGGVTLLARSPFLVFLVGVLTVAAAIVLWLELLVRAAAVYVIVLMLPLAFAAMVWPARRIWAVRAVELLVALILSKFVIVAVLSLGGAAFSSSFLSSISGTLAGLVLLVLGTLAPWALLRLLPLGELASGAVASLRGELVGAGSGSGGRAWHAGLAAHEWEATTADMRRQAQDVDGAGLEDAAGAPFGRAAETILSPTGASSEPDPQPSGGGEGEEPEQSEREAAAADPTAGNGRHGAEEPNHAAERSPGLGPIWQTEDYSWPVLNLGLDDGWPPPAIADTPEGRTAAAGNEANPGRTAEVSDGPGIAAGPGSSTAGHEIHDPTPPPQPPETSGG